MKIFNLILSFAIILCPGCSEQLNNIQLKKIAEIDIEISESENFSFHQYLSSGKNEYLICLNNKPPAFSFYNLETKQKEISIPLKECPDFSIKQHYAHLINKDSVLILNSLKNQLLLINNNGNKISEWQMDTNEKNGDFGLLSKSTYPLRLINNKIFVSSVRKDIRLITKEALKEYYNSPSNLIVSLGTSTLKQKKYFGKFPKSYSDGIKTIMITIHQG